ncbi:UDP-2,3-diacylglucosamine hydrolase [Acinetobacter nectaris CIP 110549]|uniref:UDP-2,3-diacylglucosamine hydrolase n=1 Tax=Acinetobacter nectaris CIP 110549 TaxID=1392540 RepID=V2TRV4_9GAMM|nr:UDP-2,3-diacylglucosamine diphosphatase [Acinetobacter nectaris]ESK40312.1 UDP-2,3-diacylglucosamine hydrolase [Acinetobacter nectaris CIP 110549]
MTYLFISDLHLSQNHPRLVRGFFALLQHYQNKNTQLYILGDWFNAWIGDDDTSPWLEEIVQQLKCFTQVGNTIYFQVGNRDFALGQKFLDQFSGHLLPDTYILTINHKKYRLEHGDALCTDDISYQRFKKIIRNPILLGLLKKTPLGFRRKLANGFRKKSTSSQQEKSYDIMDVNPNAVSKALENNHILIHGHTHRPTQYNHQSKQRIVLGDWREATGEAQILEISEQGKQLFYTWKL